MSASPSLPPDFSSPKDLAPSFRPARLIEIDLARPWVPIAPASDLCGRPYHRALALVRWGRRPLGMIELPLDHGVLDRASCLRWISHELRPGIGNGTRQDGPPVASELAEDLDYAGLLNVHGPVHPGDQPTPLNELPPVSIVVATRDRPAELDAALRSLLALDYPQFDVFVVDSAPASEATAELLRSRFGGIDRLHYRRASSPGLAIAHNLALQEITASIVAFTDDDVEVDCSWLLALVEDFRASPRIGCVTGMILPFELETAAQDWLEQFGGFSKGFERRIFDLLDNRPNHPLFPFAAGMFGSGANMAFRTAMLRDIGGFDPALGAGTIARSADDLAAFVGIIMAGHSLVYQPAAIVRHRHRRDYAGLRRQTEGYGIGMGALLAKLVIERPSCIGDLVLRAAGGLHYVLSPSSSKNRGKSRNYPTELTRLEVKGLLQGPAAYLRSRRATRASERSGWTADTASGPARILPHARPIPILLYHSIDDGRVDRRYRALRLATTAFAEHMAFLKGEGYHPLTVSELAAVIRSGDERGLAGRPVAITFDDSLADFHEGALPILSGHGFAATLYVVTGFIGRQSQWLEEVGEGRRAMLSWQQIQEIADRRIELGAHSHTHPQLDLLERRNCLDQIRRSKLVLEQKTGRPVTSFAYPYGYFDREVRRIVVETGFTSACAVRNSMSSLADDVFALARFMITPEITLGRLAMLLDRPAPPAAPRERLRTTGWRLVRGWRSGLAGSSVANDSV